MYLLKLLRSKMSTPVTSQKSCKENGCHRFTEKDICRICEDKKFQRNICTYPNCIDKNCKFHRCNYKTCDNRQVTTSIYCREHKCKNCNNLGNCSLHLKELCIYKTCIWNQQKGQYCYRHACALCENPRHQKKFCCEKHMIEEHICRYKSCNNFREGNLYCSEHRCQTYYCENLRLFGELCRDHIITCEKCTNQIGFAGETLCRNCCEYCDVCKKPSRGNHEYCTLLTKFVH